MSNATKGHPIEGEEDRTTVPPRSHETQARGTLTARTQGTEGADLAAILSERGPLGGNDVRILFAGICDALGAMHESGLVHGAIGPHNVLFTRGSGAGADPPFTVEVRPDLQPATPAWGAPEVNAARVGEKITTAADVWALGLLAFTLLTGRSFWRAGGAGHASSTDQLLREVVVDPLPSASRRAAELGARNLLPAHFDA